MFKKPLSYTELLRDAVEIEFLLEVSFAGRVYRWSTRGSAVPLDDGTEILFAGGLEVDYSDPLDLFNESPSFTSVPFSLIFPDDIAELISQGHDLYNSAGTLSLWVPGRTYEQRIVLINGTCIDPEYGAASEPVSFSLQSNSSEDTALWPPATMRIYSDTYSDADPNYDELYYPIIIGQPGISGAGAGDQVPGSPAYAVVTPTLANPTILVAGHPCSATSVTLINKTQEEATGLSRRASLSVTTTADGLGQQVTTGTYNDATMGAAYVEGDELVVIWHNGGGILNERETADLRGAGEVIVFMLRKSTLSFDAGRWRSVESYLNQRFKIDCYIDEPVVPAEWLTQNIYPLLNMSLVNSTEGLAPVIWRREATHSDAVGKLTAGSDCSRSGPVLYEYQQIINEVRFSYGLDATDNEFYRAEFLVGEIDLVEDPYALARPTVHSEYSRASFYRYGSHATEMSSDVVYEPATVYEILNWMSRAYSLPYRVVTYDVATRWSFLNRGDVVTITDAEIHLTDKLALVRDIAWSLNRVSVTLVLIEDPPLTSRV